MFGIPTLPVVTKTLTAANSFVTLYYASPGGTPRHLVVRMNVISDSTGDGQTVKMRFNGDSGNTYNSQYMKGVSSTASSQQFTSRADHPLYDITDTAHNGGEVVVPDAFSTRTDKSFLGQFGKAEEGVFVTGGRWENTAAITSVTLLLTTGKFAATSTFELAVVDEAYVIDETINTGSAQFDHASISAADGDLVIIGNLRSDVSSNIEEVSIRFNNDTGGNYLRQRINASNGTNIGAYASTSPVIAHSAAANADTDSFSGLIVQIPNFSDGSNDRTAMTLGGGHFSDSDQIIGLYNTRWNDTTAINRVAVYGKNASTGFLANSMLSIYAVPKGLIERTELGSDTSSVTFSSIPASYDHLELTVYARNARDGTQTLAEIALNADATDANYNTQALYGVNSTITAEQAHGTGSARRIIETPGATATANVYGGGTVTLYNYTKTDRYQHYLAASGIADVSTNNAVRIYSGRWESTAAITSIVITTDSGSDFLAGSVFELRGISATPSTSEAANVNTVAIASIAAINTIAISSIQAMNTVAMAVAGGGTSYAGITWSTSDALPATAGAVIKIGIIGAQAVTGGNSRVTYEHSGSSWSTTGSNAADHEVAGGGGTQDAGVVFGGWDGTAGDDSVITEEYNGSTWSSANNMVGGFAFGTGSGTLQTACLATGGSTYSPTVRDIPLTQTYNGTNWANEGVDSSGQGTGAPGESGGGGLDAFLSASGALESGVTSACQVFNQTAGSWTSKAACGLSARYTGSSTDGTRVYKIAGYDAPSFTTSVVVESWVENTWTTENSIPSARRQSGLGGGVEASGGASAIGGNGASGATDTYYIAAAS